MIWEGLVDKSLLYFAHKVKIISCEIITSTLKWFGINFAKNSVPLNQSYVKTGVLVSFVTPWEIVDTDYK